MPYEEQILNFGVSIITILDNRNIPWDSDLLTNIMYNAIKQTLPYQTCGNNIGVYWDAISDEQFTSFMQTWVSELSKYIPKNIIPFFDILSKSPELAKQLKEMHKPAEAAIKTILGESPN